MAPLTSNSVFSVSGVVVGVGVSGLADTWERSDDFSVSSIGGDSMVLLAVCVIWTLISIRGCFSRTASSGTKPARWARLFR